MRSWHLLVAIALLPTIALSLVYGLLVATDQFGNQFALRPYELWANQFGTTPAGTQLSNGVSAMSANGNCVFVAGYMALGPGANGTLFVRMYDSSNHAVWTKQFGNGSFGYITGLVSTTDSVYVSGMLNLSAFIGKYDLTGVEEWTSLDSATPTSFFYPPSLAVGSAVYSATHADINNTYYLVLRSFDFNGNLQWTRYSQGESVYGLYENSGGIYMAGLASVSTQDKYGTVGPFLGKYDLQGHQIWNDSLEKQYVDLKSISGDDTGVYMVGTARSGPYPEPVVTLLRKYDFNGALLWSTQFGSAEESQIATDRSGPYVIAQGGVDSYLLKFDSVGRSTWTLQLPSIEGFTNAISVAPGGVYVAGSTWLSFRGVSTNAIVAEYSLASSLIFFGLSPPLSFIALATAVGGATSGCVFVWTRWRSRRSRLSVSQRRRIGLHWTASRSY